jgi:hypothetical protein
MVSLCSGQRLAAVVTPFLNLIRRSIWLKICVPHRFLPKIVLAAMAGRLSIIADLETVCSRLHHTVVRCPRDPSVGLRRQRIVACVIWMLSGCAWFSVSYLLSRGCTATGTSVADVSLERTLLLLTDWLAAESWSIFDALSDIENPYRVEADSFLVRSLVAAVVYVQSMKGVVVSTSEAIFHYLRFWSLRPVAAALQPALRKLAYSRNARRKFGQLLRREWMLEYGSYRTFDELSNDVKNHRVLAINARHLSHVSIQSVTDSCVVFAMATLCRFAASSTGACER